MKTRISTVKSKSSQSDELEKFKSFLGPLAEDYGDGQLRQLQNEMHLMAEILLKLYLHQKKS